MTRTTEAKPTSFSYATDQPDSNWTEQESSYSPGSSSEDAEWAEFAETGWYRRWGKPLCTFVLLALTLVPATLIALPIALVNWVLYRDARRIFYRQQRMGWQNRPFEIYKFRTMREAPGSDFQNWQRGDSSRVTAFGALLRRTHLDELPQLLNILRGEMTFIGPRPEMVEVERWAAQAVPGFDRRLAVRPGITGHAQVTQGHTYMNASAYREKLRANAFYLEHMSFRFDLAILARTILCMTPLPLKLRAQVSHEIHPAPGVQPTRPQQQLPVSR